MKLPSKIGSAAHGLRKSPRESSVYSQRYYKEQLMLKYNIILILSIIVVFLLYDRVSTTNSTINTIDTVYIENNTPIDVKRSLPKLIYLSLPNEPIDTEEVVKSYYTRKIIVDTLKLDNYDTVTLNSNLYKNNIDTLSFTYELGYYPSIKQYNYMVGVSYDINGFQLLAGYTKKRLTYFIGYSPKINNFSLGLQFKF